MGKSFVTRAAVGVAAALIVVLAAGCGGGDGTSGDGASDAASTSASSASAESGPPTTVAVVDVPVVTEAPDPTVDPAGNPADTTVATTEAPAPSGSLRVGLATDLQTFDPHLAQPAQLHYLDLVYDTLTAIAPDGSVTPRLASSITSEDLVTWTIEVAEGATFASGAPVTADAIVYSLERGRAAVASPSAPAFAQIASVEAINDTTAVVTLTVPNVAFPRDLAGLPGMIVDPASDGTDLSRSPAGSGPYSFDADGTVEGAEYHYTARSDYWGDAVGAADVTLALIVDPTARINALQSGQIDIAAEIGPAEQVKLGDSAEVVVAPTSEPLIIQMVDTDGQMVPAFGDQRVREAMSLAIDREGIVNALLFGGGIPTTAFYPEGSPYYAPEVDEVGYDPERAKALLAEAGYADGFTFTTPIVEPLRLLAEAVAASLAEVGITMDMEMQQPGTIGEQVRAGDWAANVTIVRGETAASYYNDRFPPDAPFNPFQADRSSVVALGDAALAATTEDEAESLWAQTYAEAVNQGYVIVIAHITTGAGVTPGVTGVTIPVGSLVPDLRAVHVDG